MSAVSIWEIEIKRAVGKLRAPDDVPGDVVRFGLERLDITFEHAYEAGRLPPLHQDPFDRMLVAQAKLERLTLATADAALAEYGVPILEVSAA